MSNRREELANVADRYAGMLGFSADAYALIDIAKILRLTCEWKQDAEGSYKTTCGELFIPGKNPRLAENDMAYCCYCGGRLVGDDRAS